MEKFQTLDLYLASFLTFHGIQPSFENTNGKIAFSFLISDELYRLISKYNADETVPVNSFVTVIKRLRGQMLTLKEQKEV